MIRKDTSPAEMIVFLNELLKLDPEWMKEIVNHRPMCNDAIAEHPTVQAGEDECQGEYHYTAGFLGVINGFFGTFDDGPNAGCGPVAAVVDNGKLIRFCAFDKEGA